MWELSTCQSEIHIKLYILHTSIILELLKHREFKKKINIGHNTKLFCHFSPFLADVPFGPLWSLFVPFGPFWSFLYYLSFLSFLSILVRFCPLLSVFVPHSTFDSGLCLGRFPKMELLFSFQKDEEFTSKSLLHPEFYYPSWKNVSTMNFLMADLQRPPPNKILISSVL
jgi:hypothetical protein